MNIRLVCIALVVLLGLPFGSACAEPATLEQIADQVISKHMSEKKIPGLSVAIVHRGQLVLAKGYGVASVEFAVPADVDSVYPVSSIAKMFTGMVAVRLASAGVIDLDTSIANYLNEVPDDKRGITLRHLLQHTHGLEDFYQSDDFARETGHSLQEADTDELISWSMARPLRFSPGSDWAYSLVGYVVLGRILELVSHSSYSGLVEREVFDPLDIKGYFGGTEIVIGNRNPVLYEWSNGKLENHVVDFPRKVWPAGGINLSVNEFAKLFFALDRDEFLDDEQRKEMWGTVTLANGQDSHYGLGWTSYITSQNRHAVGHEGGGASWVLYYPDRRLAVIALSNMSGARADSLPYEIARAAFAAGLIPDQVD